MNRPVAWWRYVVFGPLFVASFVVLWLICLVCTPYLIHMMNRRDREAGGIWYAPQIDSEGFNEEIKAGNANPYVRAALQGKEVR